MSREFRGITAGQLIAGDKFSFENTHGATVFDALGVYTYFDMVSHRMTEITLSHNTKFIMAYASALYRVTEPIQIPVTQLSVGDRYSMYIEDSEIFTVVSVSDGSVMVPTTPPDQWIWIGIGDNRYHTFQTKEYVTSVYRYPALSSVTAEPEGDRYWGTRDLQDWARLTNANIYPQTEQSSPEPEIDKYHYPYEGGSGNE